MKNFSTSIQPGKRGKRTEYLGRLTYYYRLESAKAFRRVHPRIGDAKRELQDLIDQHVAGGSEVLEARNMTFAALRRALRPATTPLIFQRLFLRPFSMGSPAAGKYRAESA